jgi:acyl carrier protein
MESIELAIKKHVLENYLQGQDPNELTEITPLITTGILDSMATLKLALFLEEQFSISVEPQEVSEKYMNTIEKIAELVRSKNPSIS